MSDGISSDPEVAAAEAKLSLLLQEIRQLNRMCGAPMPERCETCRTLIVPIPEPTADEPSRVIPQAFKGVRWDAGKASVYFQCSVCWRRSNP